ncbi:hypothetical protein BIS44_1386, partial [Mycobacterium tuberculosis variant bovis BCG]
RGVVDVGVCKSLWRRSPRRVDQIPDQGHDGDKSVSGVTIFA